MRDKKECYYIKKTRNKKNISEKVVADILPKVTELFCDRIKDTLIKFHQIQTNNELMKILNDARHLPISLEDAIQTIIQSKQSFLNEIISQKLFKSKTQ